MIEDRNLTDHFTLFELTKTSHSDLQEQNRDINEFQIAKLTALARLLEHVRFILGTPLTITSGYRCPELNKRIGGTDNSQHSLCEAADFIPGQIDVGTTFRLLWKDIKVNGANVGQLIHENDNGKEWIHISLGTPYRDADQCKQIVRAHRGDDGKMKYTTLA